MGVHHFDIAQWALGMDYTGPTEIHPPAQGDTGLRFVYANGIEMFHGGPSDCTFMGTDGSIDVGRSGIRSTPAAILQTPLGDRDVRLASIGNSHRQNWIDCIRSRRRPIAEVEIGARSAQVCQLANIGYRLRRMLRWGTQAARSSRTTPRPITCAAAKIGRRGIASSVSTAACDQPRPATSRSATINVASPGKECRRIRVNQS